ncbi:tetraspanin-14-like [Ixodes scapularis]|uniref:tetraspanin-14-like n=1 Tax=Ixodes scapularis TaxID=6945 RepID=UPI001C387930|nr:tetraspanin-14-like [Ixodes scapularis]
MVAATSDVPTPDPLKPLHNVNKDFKTSRITLETGKKTKNSHSSSLSSTVRLDVSFIRRAIIVGTNLLVMLLSLVVLWASFGASHNRPGQSIAFWSNLFNKSFLFTFVMHFEIALILISVLALITSSAGFLGALRENVFFLHVYHVGIVIFLGSDAIVAFLVAFLPHVLRNFIKRGGYVDFITSYRESPDLQNIIDNLQETLRCCGLSRDSFRDWELNDYFRCLDANPSRERCGVPASCCRVNNTATNPPNALCGSGILLTDEQNAWANIYTRSCADAALSYFRHHMLDYIFICVALALFMVFLLVTSVILLDDIKNMRLIYSTYYGILARGQEGMKRANVSLPASPKAGTPLGEDDAVMKALRHHIGRAHSVAVGGMKSASASLSRLSASHHSKPRPKEGV